MKQRKWRKRSRLEIFFRNLWLVILERLSAAGAQIKLEWDYYVTRAWIWRSYKELDAAHYDPETGFFDSSVDPQDVNQGELYLEAIKTRKLLRLAARLHVQTPEESPDNYHTVSWDYDSSEPKYLTQKGLSELLPALREAQKERREAAGFWFGIAVGLIGAVTGLLAVLSKT